MEIIIKLSTGKEISLTPEEAQELLKLDKVQVVPVVPYSPPIYPYPWGPWPGPYPGGYPPSITYTSDSFTIDSVQ